MSNYKFNKLYINIKDLLPSKNNQKFNYIINCPSIHNGNPHENIICNDVEELNILCNKIFCLEPDRLRTKLFMRYIRTPSIITVIFLINPQLDKFKPPKHIAELQEWTNIEYLKYIRKDIRHYADDIDYFREIIYNYTIFSVINDLTVLCSYPLDMLNTQLRYPCDFIPNLHKISIYELMKLEDNHLKFLHTKTGKSLETLYEENYKTGIKYFNKYLKYKPQKIIFKK